MNIELKSDVKPVYARHETFHPRYSWLKKGFDKASSDSEIFSKEEAPVILGVGKNMVKAIKYWSVAFKVLDERRLSGNISSVHEPSEIGKKLLDDNGWDPYLEDLSSLWLLHWHLLKTPNFATAWYFIFNIFNKNVFTLEDILTSLIEFNARNFPTKVFNESSLIKDINCLLRMYVEQTSKKIFREDSIDCPFTELGIIKSYGDKKHYAFNIGPKPSLSPEIIVATCLEFSHSIQEAKTISISRLLYEHGSPGQCLKITENVISDSIEKISKQNKNISLSEQAGLVQLQFTKEPLMLADKILSKYYEKRMN